MYASDSGAPSWWSFDDAIPPLSLGVRDCGTPINFMAFDLGTMSHGRTEPGSVGSEGYKDLQTGCTNFEVKPSESRIIYFKVDEKSGPGPTDPSSILHLYSSHVGRGTMPNRPEGFDGFGSDQDAGLLGPLIITRKGAANAAGVPTDVDKEFVVVMGVYDENDSPYLRKNIWDHVVAPQISAGGRPSGYLPFGPTSKPAVLQALYAKAARTGDKLSYTDATILVEQANAAHTYVGDVRGVIIKVWFNKDFFDPRWYDAKNGGTGRAMEAMEGLWKARSRRIRTWPAAPPTCLLARMQLPPPTPPPAPASPPLLILVSTGERRSGGPQFHGVKCDAWRQRLPLLQPARPHHGSGRARPLAHGELAGVKWPPLAMDLQRDDPVL